MIEIIENYGNEIIMNQKFVLKDSISSFLNKRSKTHFFNFKSYKQVLKNKLKMVYLIPIYLSKKEVYILTKSMRNRDCILINIKSVLGIKYIDEYKIEVVFISGKMLKFDYSYKKSLINVKAVMKIEDYLKNSILVC